ncbi:MAG: hypothetical protein E4H02_06115 [Lentisphaerales bacterium]|jgi:hypothetical protein|nr:MAG: hypothetical protein E4H02_06115 [Lentisphaerales bacterium]
MNMTRYWRITSILIATFTFAGLFPAGCATNKPEPPSPVMVRPEPWQFAENWKKLRKEMTTSEVEDILGSAGRVEKGRWLTYWRYGPRNNGPQVMFNADTMLVKTWVAPDN